MKRNKKNDRI